MLMAGLVYGQGPAGVRVVDSNGALTPQIFDNAHGNVTTAVQVSATGVVFKGYSILNTTAAACYLQVFNAASANVTLGTTAPTFAIPFAASEHVNVFPASGEFAKLGTGFTVAATTTPTGASTCAMFVLIHYSSNPTLQ